MAEDGGRMKLRRLVESLTYSRWKSSECVVEMKQSNEPVRGSSAAVVAELYQDGAAYCKRDCALED